MVISLFAVKCHVVGVDYSGEEAEQAEDEADDRLSAAFRLPGAQWWQEQAKQVSADLDTEHVERVDNAARNEEQECEEEVN